VGRPVVVAFLGRSGVIVKVPGKITIGTIPLTTWKMMEEDGDITIRTRVIS